MYIVILYTNYIYYIRTRIILYHNNITITNPFINHSNVDIVYIVGLKIPTGSKIRKLESVCHTCIYSNTVLEYYSKLSVIRSLPRNYVLELCIGTCS